MGLLYNAPEPIHWWCPIISWYINNDIVNTTTILPLPLLQMFIESSSWRSHCESSLGSLDECRLNAKRLPTLRSSQLTWAVSLPVGCYHLHPLSSFIIITQPKGCCSLYCPTEGRRLSWPRWLATYWDGLPVPVPDIRVTTLIKIAKQCHTASKWHHLVGRVVRQLLCEVRCQHSGDWFLNGRIIGRCVFIAN